ncbi:MAG: hypothetical protein CFE25_15125 [Chitinophagaceae bacterium BSSC1]|nr:MAG: hypothetical protein CFE25_15125 [Chitinophagaceae bacterium BSSC1]
MRHSIRFIFFLLLFIKSYSVKSQSEISIYNSLPEKGISLKDKVVTDISNGTLFETFIGNTSNFSNKENIKSHINNNNKDYKSENYVSLAAGDIAIIGFNCDPSSSLSKTFAIVALADLSANEVLYFSDKAYYQNAFGPLLGNGSEGIFSWTIPVGGVPKGTVIMFTLTSGASPSVTTSPSTGTTNIIEGWTSTSPTVSPFGQNGDNLLIYQGSEASPTFIFGYNSGNNTTTVVNGWNTGVSTNPNAVCELPNSLTAGTTAIGFNSVVGYTNIDNLKYNGTQTGTKAALLSAICNPNNWIVDDINDYNFTPGSGVFSGSQPIFNLSSSNTTITSILKGTPSGSTTNANSVTYNILFGSSITGLSTSNFSLTSVGVSGASITSLSGTGASYNVVVNTGTGSGSITLNLANATGLSPSVSTSLPYAGEVYTIDKTAPTVVTQGRTVLLNISGTGSVTAALIDNGSNDASGVASLGLSQTSFTCANIGSNTVTLTVTDNAGNSATGTATVIVSDNIVPVVVTQNRTITIGNTGTATVSALQINNGSSDACGVASLGLSKSSFTAADLGANTVTLTVTDINNNSNTGTAIVTVLASSTADLTSMLLSAGTLSPAFASGTTSYTASVANNISSITVTPTRTQANASIEVRVNAGVYASVTSGTASGLLSLNVGANTIDVRVTAQDGTTQKTYSTTVTRAASNNADLSSMILSNGILTPVFASGTTVYTASVANNISSITVTPTRSESNASIEVRVNAGVYGSVTSGTASGLLSLNVGANTIDVRVTAQDGTTQKVYSTTVTRAAALSTNADLSNMVMSAGTLSPVFASGTTSYTASVANNISSITVTPTRSESNASIEVRVNAGVYASVTSGTASGLLSLNVGTNTIDVRVTAQDGTTQKTYSTTVTRAALIIPTISTSGDLAGLTTVYGTASSVTSFVINGSALVDGVLLVAPNGFEISESNSGQFSTSLLLGNFGTISNSIIYVRLSSSNTVGIYSGDIILSSFGANSQKISTVSSIVKQKPLSIIVNNQKKCQGINYNIPVNAFTVNGLINSDTLSSLTLNSAGSTASALGGSYAIKASNAIGFGLTNYLINYIDGTLDVESLPIIGSIIGPQEICSGNSLVFSSSTIGGVWKSNNNAVATISSNGSFANVNGISSGFATITYSLTSVSGCTATQSKDIVINQTIVLPDINGPSSVCTKSPVQFTNSVNGGVWSTGNTSQATINNNGFLNAINGGSINVIYTITTSSGCVSSSIKKIVINTTPDKPIITRDFNSNLVSSFNGLNSWNNITINQTINTNGSVYNPSSDGRYRVQAVNNNCISDWSDEFVYTTSSIGTLYPNPASIYTIASIVSDKSQSVILQLVDITGKVLQDIPVALNSGQNPVRINTTRLAKGVYMLVIKGTKLTYQQLIKE